MITADPRSSFGAAVATPRHVNTGAYSQQPRQVNTGGLFGPKCMDRAERDEWARDAYFAKWKVPIPGNYLAGVLSSQYCSVASLQSWINKRPEDGGPPAPPPVPPGGNAPVGGGAGINRGQQMGYPSPPALAPAQGLTKNQKIAIGVGVGVVVLGAVAYIALS